MKDTKDIFSTQASTYAAYRPNYPDALYDFLLSITQGRNTVWDCGTGNGQVAHRLAEYFKDVYATDISEKQIANAIHKDNIHYSVQRAEHTNFANDNFDLITVGTALHWFDFDNFYKEVKRIAKDGATIAAWCYAPFRSDNELDAVTDKFAYEILKDYWDAERKYVDEQYKTIPFPFEEIVVPELSIQVSWTFEHMLGYLNSWSSVQHYIKQEGRNPVGIIEQELAAYWQPSESKALTIPLFMRAGVIRK